MRKRTLFAALAAIGSLPFATNLQAAELQVFGGGPMQTAGPLLAEGFTEMTGMPAVFVHGSGRRIRETMNSDVQLDVIIISPEDFEPLVEAGLVTAESVAVIAYNGLGVGMLKGAPKPDISTPEKFRVAMLATKSLALPDPAAGTATGAHVTRIMNELGITDEVAKKAVWIRGPTTRRVVSGEAELSIGSIPEIVLIEGAELAGPLPNALQDNRPLAVGIVANSTNMAVAEEFVRYLATPEAAEEWQAGGAEPVQN